MNNDTEFFIEKIENLRWYLLMTMPRSEAKVESFFRSSGITCYLPRITHTYINNFSGKNGKKYSYKRKPVIVPMFPGYIFAALDLDTISNTRYQKSVAKIFINQGYSEEELIKELEGMEGYNLVSHGVDDLKNLPKK